MTEAGYRVRGRVQGVGFRWWTRTRARALGLSGTVRNCADGTVEVRVRGADEAVKELRRHLSSGPPGARVEEVEELPPGEVPEGSFEIVR